MEVVSRSGVPEGGRKRRFVTVTVPVILTEEDSAFWGDWDSVENENMDVLCVSQTKRKAGDPEVQNRNAIVVKREDGNWEEGFKRHNYVLALHQTLICAEAFKVLEADFTGCLKSLGRLNGDTSELLEPFVKRMASRQGNHISGISWYDHISFASFAGMLVEMTSFNSEHREICEVEQLILSQGMQLFKDVLLEGIASLEEDMANLGDVKLIEATDFMRETGNAAKTLKEWALLGGLRVARNANAHPFRASATRSERQRACDFLETTLQDEFCEGFKHVAFLSLMKVKLEEGKLRVQEEEKRKQSLQDYMEALDAMKGRRRLNAMQEGRQKEELAISELEMGSRFFDE